MLGGYIHFLYKILLEKKRRQDPVCYVTDLDSGEGHCVVWESVFRLPVCVPHIPKVPFA